MYEDLQAGQVVEGALSLNKGDHCAADLITINKFLLEGMAFFLCIKEIANRFLGCVYVLLSYNLGGLFFWGGGGANFIHFL